MQDGARLRPVEHGEISGIHHVVAGLLVQAGRILLCHRSAGRAWYPDVWDFPGGHIEDGEAPSAALVRELREELGICIPELAGPAFAHLRGSDLDCPMWVIREWSGTPHIASFGEHDDLGWWSPDGIGGLRLADERYGSLIERAVGAALGYMSPEAGRMAGVRPVPGPRDDIP